MQDFPGCSSEFIYSVTTNSAISSEAKFLTLVQCSPPDLQCKINPKWLIYSSAHSLHWATGDRSTVEDMTLIAKAARQDRIKKKKYTLLSSFLFLKIDIHNMNVNLLSYLISWSSVLKWMVCYFSFFTHWHVELQYWGSTDDCFFLCSCMRLTPGEHIQIWTDSDQLFWNRRLRVDNFRVNELVVWF